MREHGFERVASRHSEAFRVVTYVYLVSYMDHSCCIDLKSLSQLL